MKGPFLSWHIGPAIHFGLLLKKNTPNSYLTLCKHRLYSSIKHLMTVAYDLLNRDLYGRITEAHLLRRQTKDKFVMTQ